MLRHITALFIIINFSVVYASEVLINKDYIPLQARRLTSDREHLDFLKDVLQTAQDKVCITTYSISPQKISNEGIGQAIITASKRGVRIYIYFEHLTYENQFINQVASFCEKFEENANHAKCVSKDKECVAIGSYNWLSEWGSSSNASLVISGCLAFGLIEDVWQGIRFYQSLKYDNEQGIINFIGDQDAFSTGQYEFSPQQFFYTLRTPDAHCLFLEEVLTKAKQEVLLSSPFIRLQKLQSTITPQLLTALKSRNVQLTLITLPTPCDKNEQEQQSIFTCLNQLASLHLNFSYKTQKDIHAKTLIVDTDVICEGSFNWLSAVNNIDHSANNFEMSVGLRGLIAQQLIVPFKSAPVGQVFQTNDKKRTNDSQIQESSKKPHKIEKKFIEETNKNADDFFKILPSNRHNIQGYCVRFNDGEYIRDQKGNILYFRTTSEAKKAAIEEQYESSGESSDDFFEILPSNRYNIQGYCVRFNGNEYIRDKAGNIIYFRTKREAEKAANDVS